MADFSLRDWLFGSGALRKAAGTEGTATPSAPASPAGIDIAKMAQGQADKIAADAAKKIDAAVPAKPPAPKPAPKDVHMYDWQKQ